MTVLLAGLCTIDVVQRVDELPAPGEKVQSRSVDVAAGGPATNAAVTVSALGGTAVLWTVLGTHPLADLARADLAACGVDVVDADPAHADPPALSAVAVRDRDGERTVVSRNASGHKSAKAPALDFPDDVGAVLLDGHHPELALAAAREANRRGVPVVLDAGSWKPVLGELLPLVDIAACSAQFRAPGATLRERGVTTVITTAGAEPVRWWADGQTGEVPVPRVVAVDTLGAGDVWHGALAYGRALAGEIDLPRLIEFANEFAAERVRYAGPRTWFAEVRAKRMGVR
jgi:sugar/nucleoside kinase (ribokinase family)